MKCHEFETHLMDLLGEGRNPAPEGEAGEHLETCEVCRRQTAEFATLWERLPRADPVRSGLEVPSFRMKERFEDSLAAVLEAQRLAAGREVEASGKVGQVFLGPWTRPVWAALAATLVAGVALGFFFGGRVSTSTEIQALRMEMHAVSETVAVALMEHDSASERLRGIALSSGSLSTGEGGDVRIIEALFERVHNDPNDNVRVAAVEALAGAIDRVEVKEGLAASLGSQESPEVQAVVLEALARADRGMIDEALSSEELDDDVRRWFLAVAPTSIG